MQGASHYPLLYLVIPRLIRDERQVVNSEILVHKVELIVALELEVKAYSILQEHFQQMAGVRLWPAASLVNSLQMALRAVTRYLGYAGLACYWGRSRIPCQMDLAWMLPQPQLEELGAEHSPSMHFPAAC